VRFTHVIEIAFQSLDPSKAATIANNIAEAYILDQTQSRRYTTQRATAWLEERMNQLRDQAVAADRTAQDFRTQNNIIAIRGGPIDEQQMGELTSQLVAARSETAEAKARLDTLHEVITSGRFEAAPTETVKNEIFQKIRQQYVDVSNRYTDYAERFGTNHLAVVALRRDIQRLRSAGLEELKRMVQGYQSNYEVAQLREEAVKARLDAMTEQNAGSRQAQSALRVLESAAQAYRTLHESFMQRYVEATQQQNVTSTEARVITPAVGASKVHPNNNRTLGLAAVLSLMIGCGIGFARERLDRVFRTPKQVEQALGVECLGILPAIPHKTVRKPTTFDPDELERREIAQDLGIARQVILTPFSRFTETIRGIKVAADTNRNLRDVHVIGVVSAVPAEGKSTVAANLAQLLAQSGNRTLLIDADFRNPSLTRIMAPGAQFGTIDLLHRNADLLSLIWRDPITGLDFLPTVLTERIAHTSEMLASSPMQELIEVAKKQYEYVIVDFPPIAPVVDAKAASHLIDAFLLVIEWGRTSTEAIAESLASAELIQSKLLGAVLNRANPVALKRLEAYKGYNYHQYYSTYVSNNP
jgi:succinoglycan biosynthesis transport protein ExoP